jgi:pectinesterase
LYIDKGYQFYRNCEIFGTIDFIYGQSTNLIQNSAISMRNLMQGQDNVVVADDNFWYSMFNTEIVLQNCSIMPDVELKPYLQTGKTYLVRPWKSFSTAVFLNNYTVDFVQWDGYKIWNKTQLNTKNMILLSLEILIPVPILQQG